MSIWSNRGRWVTVVATLLGLVLLLAACGSPSSAPTPTPTIGSSVGNTSSPAPTATAAVPTPTSTAAASPTAPPVSFAGKTITIIVGTAPGGGFDTVARIYAKYLPNYLPGHPRFVVKNIPGSGQLLGHQVAYTSTPNGLTVGMLHSRWVTNQVILGQHIAKWDATKIFSLGNPTAASDANLFCVKKSTATSWEQLLNLGRTITSGEPSPGDPGVDLLQYLGLPFKVVYGYGGSSEVVAAFDRGELDIPGGYCTEGYIKRLYPDLIGNIVPLFWNRSPKPPDAWLKTLGVNPANVPNEVDLPGVNLTAAQKATFQVYEQVSLVSRMFFLPPGVPTNIQNAWVQAVKGMAQDPGFIQSMDVAGYAANFGFDEPQYQALIQEASGLDSNSKKLLQQFLGA